MSDMYGLGEPEPTSTEADPTGAPEGESTTEPQAEAPRQYFDLDDDVASRYVKVKVDGEDQEVTLGEALRGYSREADYTRKTQALAQQRQQAEYALTLQRALEAQPEETIRLLARQAGLTLAEENQLVREQQGTQPDPYADDDRFTDPMEQKLSFMERRLQEIDERDQRAAANNALQMAIGGLQRNYGADEATVREVVTRALQLNAGPESFDMIYKTVEYDRAQQARAQVQQRTQLEDQQRTQAKTQAGQVVSTGGSAAQAGAPPPPQTNFNTYREVIEASLDQVGANFPT